MKPNKNQIALCQLVELNSKYWMNTNDISSPTHGGDLFESIQSVQNWDELNLSESQQKEFESKMNDLLNFIQKV